MSKRLTGEQVTAYERDGYVFPLRAFGQDFMADNRARLAALEEKEGGRISRRTNMKPHLLLPWLNEIIRRPEVLDPVEDILGPNILCWGSGFFAKKAGDGGFVSWHQDAFYWGLSTPDVLTAWIAFTPSTTSNGCMRVVPGTHKIDMLPHADTFAKDNMLSRGQEIAVDVDEKAAVDIVLQPGEMSLHHVRIVHGSDANTGDIPRVGYAVRYMSSNVRQLSPIRDSATLVRGKDEGHFDLEPTPKSDFHPDAVAYHASMIDRQAEILYAGATQRPQELARAGAM